MNHSLRRRWVADLSLLGITFIWGSTFVVVKEALDSSSTLFFLALRFTLAAAVLGLLFRRRLRAESEGRGTLRAGLLVGGFLFLGYLFQTLGLRLTTPAKSALITGLATLLIFSLFTLVLNAGVDGGISPVPLRITSPTS